MMRPKIEPRSPVSLTDTLPTSPMSRLFIQIFFGGGVRIVIIIGLGNAHSDMSSNPCRD